MKYGDKRDADSARKALQAMAIGNYGKNAGWSRFIRQPVNNETKRLGVDGWHARILWLSSELQFAEMYIDNCSRWVGCPNPPNAYIVLDRGKAYRFRDYGRALCFAWIRAIKQARARFA